MPKLPALTPTRVMRALERNGFIADRTTGSHVVYYHPERHIRVVVPFHRKDIAKGTLLAILRHAGLDKSDIS